MDEAVFELVIPLRAEYVSIARLTVSGVANRAGFDFDTIEDIKVSLSEVCNHLISGQARAGAGKPRGAAGLGAPGVPGGTGAGGSGVASGSGVAGGSGKGLGRGGRAADCRMRFALSDEGLAIDILSGPSGALSWNAGAGDAGEYENLGPSLISLLMDEFAVEPYEGCVVSMKKRLDPSQGQAV
jgi:anti-sigma regulatory factor (Ser/Thr protein kinase)